MADPYGVETTGVRSLKPDLGLSTIGRQETKSLALGYRLSVVTHLYILSLGKGQYWF